MTKEQLAVLKQASDWLNAIGTWLLETDNDMVLPDGILDEPPEFIADELDKIVEGN